MEGRGKGEEVGSFKILRGRVFFKKKVTTEKQFDIVV